MHATLSAPPCHVKRSGSCWNPGILKRLYSRFQVTGCRFDADTRISFVSLPFLGIRREGGYHVSQTRLLSARAAREWKAARGGMIHRYVHLPRGSLRGTRALFSPRRSLIASVPPVRVDIHQNQNQTCGHWTMSYGHRACPVSIHQCLMATGHVLWP